MLSCEMKSLFSIFFFRSDYDRLTLTIYFRFPLKDTYKNKWYNFLGENGILPDKVSKTSLVCSAHFDESFFVMGKSRRLLLKHAIPTKIINRIKCVSVHFEQIKKTK